MCWCTQMKYMGAPVLKVSLDNCICALALLPSRPLALQLFGFKQAEC